MKEAEESDDDDVARQVAELFGPIKKLEVLDFTLAVLRDSVDQIKAAHQCEH